MMAQIIMVKLIVFYGQVNFKVGGKVRKSYIPFNDYLNYELVYRCTRYEIHFLPGFYCFVSQRSVNKFVI